MKITITKRAKDGLYHIEYTYAHSAWREWTTVPRTLNHAVAILLHWERYPQQGVKRFRFIPYDEYKDNEEVT